MMRESLAKGSAFGVVSVKDAPTIDEYSDLEVLPLVVIVEADIKLRIGVGVGRQVPKGSPSAFVSEYLADGDVLEVASDPLIPGR